MSLAACLQSACLVLLWWLLGLLWWFPVLLWWLPGLLLRCQTESVATS